MFEGKVFKVKKRKYEKSAEAENSLRNDVLVFKLVLTGKIFPGVKMMVTGFEFLEKKQKDETDLETQQRDNRVVLNYNNISPLRDQNVRLGLFVGIQRPTLLQVWSI